MHTKQVVTVLCYARQSLNNSVIGVNQLSRIDAGLCGLHLDPLRRARASCARHFFLFSYSLVDVIVPALQHPQQAWLRALDLP